MPRTYTQTLDTPAYKGTVSINTGLFINGQFVDAVKGDAIDVYNPATGKVITSVAAGSKDDVDIAVAAAKKAYKTSWGLKVPGAQRGRLLSKLADLIERDIDEFAALESLNTGRPFTVSKALDMTTTIATLRYYAGFADKIQGKTIETSELKLAYTRHEPYGVVGQIVPWNFPLSMVSWKISPALATGNTIVLKPSEVTPLTAQKLASIVIEAGFPPGVLNIVNGYGPTVGQAIAEHPVIEKVAFTGSTATGRRIQEASAKSNLKALSLELGGKSPNIIFDDADLEQAVKWAARSIFPNGGQVCSANSRILVQEGIYDAFVEHFIAAAKSFEGAAGDPFELATQHGPQGSQTQLDRVLGYLDIAKKEGGTILTGGERLGDKGYFVQPTIFAGTNDMKAVREEIFGPVAALIKFKTEEEAIEIANDSVYGLAAAVFTENNARAIRVAHALEAGSLFVNNYNWLDNGMPFGGYKQSGVGRDLGEYALDTYTHVKAVHVNLGLRL
ncbi:aldehyde dehydrogenase [Hymenopellis radicata]|nr:aldehyde dehydrogenase [Hymenopellis radicata]